MQNFGDTNPDLWVAYDYGVGIDPVEMYLQASTGDIVARTATTFTLQYSDTGLSGPWTDLIGTGFPDPWITDGQVQVQDLDVPAVNIDTEQLRSLALYNFSTPEVYSTQLRSIVAFREPAVINGTQLRSVVVCRGRTAQPNLVAWTFTLDGHDFYALRMGDDTTLIYDANTQQWAEWGEDLPVGDGTTNTNARWVLSTGLNWQGIGALAYEVGTDIVAGDDTFGAVYVFDATDDEDYSSYSGSTAPFTRVVQGQLTMAGRDSIPIWGVQLSGSVGEQWTGDLINVELQSSDDMGNSYFSHGINTVSQGAYDFRLDWNSLGMMNNPGRLFKVIDNGAMVRVDALDTYDGASK
jgi:hypothetical protein